MIEILNIYIQVYKSLIFTIRKMLWTHPFISYEFYLLHKHPNDSKLIENARLHLMKKDCNEVTINTELFGEITLKREGMSSEEFFELHSNN